MKVEDIEKVMDEMLEKLSSYESDSQPLIFLMGKDLYDAYGKKEYKGSRIITNDFIELKTISLTLDVGIDDKNDSF